MQTYLKIMVKSLFVYSWVFSFEVNQSINRDSVYFRQVHQPKKLLILQGHIEVISYIDKTNVSIIR